jgi:plasmid stability protein
MTYQQRRGGPVTTLHIRQLPAAVHATFKAYCARRGYTMQAAAAELLRQAATDNTRLTRLEGGTHGYRGATDGAGD